MMRAGDIAPPSEDRAQLKRLVDTLERLPPEGLNRHWRGRRYARPEVLDALLARGEEHLRTEPRRSERLGLLGIFLAGRIEGSEAWVSPGVVRAGLLVGAARRLQGKRKEAGRAFEQVSAFVAGSAEEGPYAREAGLLRWEQGRTCDAAALLTRAAEWFGEEGEAVAEAECRGLLGLLGREDGLGGGSARAATPLRLAAQGLDGAARPRLALRVQLALVLCAAERGEGEAARALLEKARPLSRPDPEAEKAGDAGLAFRWTEGRLLGWEGNLRSAEQRLLEVRSELMVRGRLGEASLVSLDLARLASRQGSPGRAESLADELAFRFQGAAGLVFALQALAVYEESALARPHEAEEAHALACRFLRQAFRAQGLAIEPPPFP